MTLDSILKDIDSWRISFHINGVTSPSILSDMNRQEILKKFKGSELTTKVSLVAEEDNKFDKDALRVDIVDGDTSYDIGYIPKKKASVFVKSKLDPTLVFTMEECDLNKRLKKHIDKIRKIRYLILPPYRDTYGMEIILN